MLIVEIDANLGFYIYQAFIIWKKKNLELLSNLFYAPPPIGPILEGWNLKDR